MWRDLFAGPTPWIILGVIVLLFGATRLPALSKSLGQSVKIFRKEIKSDDKKAADDATDDADAAVLADDAKSDKK